MQATGTSNTMRGMEYIFRRLSENAKRQAVKLPATRKDMDRYADELLTLDERKLCDMATD